MCGASPPVWGPWAVGLSARGSFLSHLQALRTSMRKRSAYFPIPNIFSRQFNIYTIKDASHIFKAVLPAKSSLVLVWDSSLREEGHPEGVAVRHHPSLLLPSTAANNSSEAAKRDGPVRHVALKPHDKADYQPVISISAAVSLLQPQGQLHPSVADHHRQHFTQILVGKG